MKAVSAHVVTVYLCRVCETHYAGRDPEEVAGLIWVHQWLLHGGQRDTPGKVTHWTIYETEDIADGDENQDVSRV